MRYHGILFDMDGTVLDTLDDLADSLNHSLVRFSLPQVEKEHVRQNLGNGAAYLVRHSVPLHTDESVIEELLKYYRSWYDCHCLIRTGPYAGIIPLMRKLRAEGGKLAIISNKPDTAVQELSVAFFPDLLELSIGESPSIRRKPAPDTVLAAAERIKLPIEDCVYIGDTEVDLQTAKNAGMPCITVTWGFRSEAQLLSAGAVTVVHDTDELLKQLL